MKKFILIAFTLLSAISFGQEDLTRILFILDASNSMNAKWGEQTRIEAAKELLAKTVDDLHDVENLEIGLRVYGHQSPITATFQDCNDTKLEVPFRRDNFNQVKTRIKSIYAKGTTPIARSLEAAAGDFPDNRSRNIIILITDGLEACDNDPCVIARKLKDKGVKVTPFVIGLGMDLSYLEKFKCIGTYADAETKSTFEQVLKTVVAKALLNTTAQINLNDVYGTPSETNVTMFLYKSGTNELKYTYTHTLNKFGNPDTLILDPQYKYDLVVNTTPRVFKNNIEIKRNQHNTIVADSPQGSLKVRFLNAAKPYQFEARIMKAGKNITLNTQKIGEIDKYIVGKYDVEILTLPRIYITADINQSKTTHLDIQAPGIIRYTAGNGIVGQIFTENSNGTWDWVCNLKDGSKTDTWQLQPGEYKLVYRQKKLKSSTYTLEKTFRINSNKTISLKL
ncbi:MAG: VWA domain-containing protein [Crocinitomicaceae bacterium]|nr:VWA domain-containing protein [Crocinitomicaceae bacterium]